MTHTITKAELQRQKDILPRNRWSRARAYARSLGMAWEIDRDWYCELIKQGCYYCGDSLANSSGQSLDRLDSSRGYYQDNVIPCCWTCNFVRRNTFTVDEMRLLAPHIAAIKQMRIDKGLPPLEPPKRGSSTRIRPMRWKRERCVYDEVE